MLSSLSLLLCLILIFNAGFINCFAVAGVDDALFWILVAVMGACGITFATVEDAHQASDTLYNNFSYSIQENLNTKAGQLAVAGAFTSAGVTFLADQWTMITQGIIEIFGNFTGVDAVLPVDNVQKLSLNNRSISIPISCNLSSSVVYQFCASSLTVVGSKCTDYVFDSNVQSYLDNLNYRPSFISILNIANTFYSISSVNNISSTTYSGNYNISLHTFQNTNNLYDISFNSRDAVSSFNYFLNQKIHFTDVSTAGFRILDANNQNIVQSGHLANTSIAVSNSICPDGLWERSGWTNWLNDLIFSDSSSALGNPGIDTTAYPGNDTWHDGSINDDVAIPGSIGIAVPGDIADIVDYSPDIARDISNTDVSIDTDVNPDVKPDVKPSSGTPNKVLPPLSLPEILFKEKFPFCLPWDLYNLFSVLDAEPETPKFVIPYKNNMLDIDEEYVIDFSKFEDSAKVIRFFVGAGFVLALILISRKMIGSE